MSFEDNNSEELLDFCCDYCGKQGKREDCTENEDGTVFLHDDCVSKWEDEHNKIFERKDYDVKCWYCNATGCDSEKDGVAFHADCE